MAELHEIRTRIDDARRRQRAQRRALDDAAVQLVALAPGEEAERFAGRGVDRRAGGETDRLAGRIEEIRREIAAERAREAAEADSLDPRRWVSQLNGAMPILLFPLRLQTRFDGDELLVRAYPDEISIEELERRLTPDELSAGERLQQAPDTSGDPKILTKREIWRGMARDYGLARAAWIRQATLAEAPPPETAATFLRIPAAWTLPERLVFLFYDEGNRLLGQEIGQPIPDGLEAGFDATRPQFGLSRRDGEIQFPPELLWQVDFAAAEKVGMALRMALNALGGNRRIKRIVVLGVRLSTDENRSAELLQELIENHRFSDGFSIVRQGTPTNVTRDTDEPSQPDPDKALAWLESDGAFTDEVIGTTAFDRESDGVRLAHALGISPAVLRYVDGADFADGSEAIAMKRALWAGTFGYYAQQILSPLFDSPSGNDPDAGERSIAAARFFYENFVFGRGPLPAIRIGDQPYGVLPVCADALDAGPQSFRFWRHDILDDFTSTLQTKMRILARAWMDAIPKLSRAGPGPNADARLLDVLSLQASSVEFFTERLIGPEYLREYVAFRDQQTGDAEFQKYTNLLTARWNSFSAAFPQLFPARPRVFDLSFFGGSWRSTVGAVGDFDRRATPLTGDVIDNLPFSEVRGIADEYPNYVRRIAELDFAAVKRGLERVGPDGKPQPVTALLYLLLRHSYLYEHVYVALRLHRHLRGTPWAAFREKELYNFLARFDTTLWDYLEGRQPTPWEVPQVGARPGSALDLIKSREELREMPNWDVFFGDVEQLHAALDVLGKLPTARLERLFAEHVDLASYRLDAWFTGVASARLLAWRVTRDDRRTTAISPRTTLRFGFGSAPLRYATGLYLGAYGWVEDVEAGARAVPVRDIPEPLIPNNRRPVTRDPDNFGLIHAPSPNHAITAAMLRSASVAQPDKTAFNIDLSSSRVRNALWVIDAVRGGQSPAAVLGYRFERSLRELRAPALQHLPKLRSDLPMPQVPAPDGGPAETIPARDVVNGLRLVQAQRDGTFPGLIAGFPQPDRDAIALAAARVADILDACGDLMLAESAHHAAQGNFERAGGVVTAAGEFTHVPSEFDVIETPRSGMALTHRLLVGMTGSAAGSQPSTPRARLEPQLNAWIKRIIGSLSKLGCTVTYRFIENDAAAQSTFTVALDELGIEPVDLVFCTDENGAGELETRIDATVRPQFEVARPGRKVDAVEIRIFAALPAGLRPVGELLPVLGQIRRLVANARGATCRDLFAPKDLHGKSPEQVENIDRGELTLRVLGRSSEDAAGRNPNSLWDRFIAARDALDPDEAADVNTWKQRLHSATLFGITEAVPALPSDVAMALDALRSQSARVRALMETRLEQASAKWTPAAQPSGNVLTLCTDVAAALLGAPFPVMPRIAPSGELAATALDLAGDRLSDWLFSVSTTREGAARLQHARVFAGSLAEPLKPLGAFQWPSQLGFWVGDTLPAFDPEQGRPVHDLVSVVVQPADTFDPTQPMSALVVDEWHELIPNEAELTGVAFHYDAPNTEPPQSLLLAISQRALANNGRWTWDELVGCIHQALTLAKMRAVSPDELRRTPLDTVLPATFLAEAATPSTISVSLLVNVSDTIARDAFSVSRKL
jgi:hypothetical protein